MALYEYMYGAGIITEALVELANCFKAFLLVS